MAIPTKPITARDGTISIQDGTAPTPLDVTIVYEDGDFQIAGLNKSGRDQVEFRDRSDVYDLRDTDQRVHEFSFSCILTALTDAAADHVLDMIRRTGSFAAAVSTWGANAADPYTLTVVLSIEGADRGGSDQTVTLTYATLEADIAEGGTGAGMKLSVKGKAFPKGATAAIVIA